MANLTSALKQLRNERRQAQQQMERLDDAIRMIERLDGRRGGRGMGRSKRTLSAAARRRIALAQKARWARWKAKRQKKAA